MIYCSSGSGSYLGKVLVPVSIPVLVPDPDLFSSLFNNKAKSVLLNGHCFPKSWPLHFMLDPGPNLVLAPDQEPECITVPVPPRQKVAVHAVLVQAPVPQHWICNS
jgi:hypothetical protein